jgi:hypothetical protein
MRLIDGHLPLTAPAREFSELQSLVAIMPLQIKSSFDALGSLTLVYAYPVRSLIDLAFELVMRENEQVQREGLNAPLIFTAKQVALGRHLEDKRQTRSKTTRSQNGRKVKDFL